MTDDVDGDGDGVPTRTARQQHRPVTRRTLLTFRGDQVTAHPLPTSGEVTVGRASWCDVRIDDASISRDHLKLSLGDAGITVTDGGSANGTLLRSVRLPEGVAVEISPNELFQAGDVTLAVQELHAAETGPARRGSGPAAPGEPHSRDRGGRAPVVVDPATRQVHDLAVRVARGDISVLITGETGVGKELLASLIHDSSRHASGPFVRVNCAAITGGLLESELFGHERGAFTGAERARTGFIESAHGGTIMLDEVGELPASAQAALLRVLEDRKVTPVGSSTARPVDVRFLAATNRDLEAEVAVGRFRADLYYRLAGVVLELPPLHSRPADIEPLARAFAAAAADRAGQPPAQLSHPVVAALQAYAWPGNVRELRNAVERAVLLADGRSIELEHLPAAISAAPSGSTGAPAAATLTGEIAALERQRIVEALERCGGNQTRAAEMLGMPRRTLVKRLATYGIRRNR